MSLVLCLSLACQARIPAPASSRARPSATATNGDNPAASDTAASPATQDALLRVGTLDISREQLSAAYRPIQARDIARGRRLSRDHHQRECERVASELILDAQLAQQVAKEGLVITQSQVDARLRERSVGSPDFARTMELRGESEATLRRHFAREGQLEALLNARNLLVVDDAEVEKEYERTRQATHASHHRAHIAHILIKYLPDGREVKQMTGAPVHRRLSRADRAKARARANEVYAQARSGETDFATLARQVSQDPSARQGGDLGIVSPRAGMIAVFSDAAFALREGEVSRPVQTRFGFHVIKMYAHYPPGELPFAAVREQISKELREAKKRAATRVLLEELSASYPARTEHETIGDACSNLIAQAT